jgi:hypothetical protein
MRFVTLYLRSRQVPAALAVALVFAVVVTQLKSDSANPQQGFVSTLLALALGLAVLGYGLGGPGAELERTAAVAWFPRRAAHVVAMAVVVAGAVLLGSDVPAGVVLRDAAGLAGLTALTASVLGRQLAWTLPVAWTGVATVLAPVAEAPLLRALSWPMQAPDELTASLVAYGLGVGGLVLYATRGSRVERGRQSA